MIMKNLILWSLILLVSSACDKDEASPTIHTCIYNRIQQFMVEEGAHSIIKINRPGEPLYWFRDAYVDSGEAVVNSDCTFICITDCECTGSNLCDNSIFQHPREIVWEKK